MNYQHIHDKIPDFSTTEKLLDNASSYLEISIKSNLSEAEAESLSTILDVAQVNPELHCLVSEIDSFIYEKLYSKKTEDLEIQRSEFQSWLSQSIKDDAVSQFVISKSKNKTLGVIKKNSEKSSSIRMANFDLDTFNIDDLYQSIEQCERLSRIYYNLASLTNLTDKQANLIEKILTWAESNPVLAFLINEIDHIVLHEESVATCSIDQQKRLKPILEQSFFLNDTENSIIAQITKQLSSKSVRSTLEKSRTFAQGVTQFGNSACRIAAIFVVGALAIRGFCSILGDYSKLKHDYQSLRQKSEGYLSSEADAGQLQQALERFNQALPLFQEVGDLPDKAKTLNNTGANTDLSTPHPNQAVQLIGLQHEQQSAEAQQRSAEAQQRSAEAQQRSAEALQKLAERYQRSAEAQQLLREDWQLKAEQQQQFYEAQKWLEEARYWEDVAQEWRIIAQSEKADAQHYLSDAHLHLLDAQQISIQTPQLSPAR